MKQWLLRVGLALARTVYVVHLVYAVFGPSTAAARRRSRALPDAVSNTPAAIGWTVVQVAGEAPTEAASDAAPPSRQRPSVTRLVLGVAGVGFALFGAWGILTHQGNSPPRQILPWWIAVVVLHDGVLAPATALAGWLVIRFLPPAARAPIQFAGIVCGLVTIFALPLLYRQGQGFEGSTLMTRDYRENLLGLLVTVAVVTAAVASTRGLLQGRTRGRAAGRLPARRP